MRSVLRRFFTPFLRFLTRLWSAVVNDIQHVDCVAKPGRGGTSFSDSSCILSAFTLAFLWLLGLVLGAYLGMKCPVSYLHTLYFAAASPPTIFGLFISTFLPFVFCMYGSYRKKKWLIYISCFYKVFTFSFCSAALSVAFGSAGWLIRFLFRFTDFMTLGVLCWFCIRSMMGILREQDYIICVAICVPFGIFDYCIVSPFLAMLIDI